MLLLKIAVLGYFFTFMQSIIHSTAAGDDEMADLPPFDGLFSAFFMLAGTVTVSFGIPIGLAVAKIFFDVEGIPTSALVATGLLGCLYFPMAFLAVAMKDSVMAANPLVVIPAIFKVPLEYFVTTIILTDGFRHPHDHELHVERRRTEQHVYSGHVDTVHQLRHPNREHAHQRLPAHRRDARSGSALSHQKAATGLVRTLSKVFVLDARRIAAAHCSLPGPMECGLTNPARAGRQQR